MKLLLLFSTALCITIDPIVSQPAPQLSWSVIPQEFADNYGSACLDGSPPGIYSLIQDPTKFIVFLEGGGWSFGLTINATLEDAATRGSQWAGSSKYNSGTMDVGGLLSTNSSVNPYFYNHSMIFFHYCDGTSFSSNATNPIPVPADIQKRVSDRAAYELQHFPDTTLFRTVNTPSQLYFRGRANLLAVFNFLKQNTTMGTATDIIISGGSAGGTAALLALDIITPIFPNSKVMGAPDAGFFLDAYNIAQQIMWYRTSFQVADTGVWNSTGSGSVNQRCLQAYPNETWKCFLPQYYAAMIQTPFIILNSAYDMWQILNDLELGCVPTTNGQGVFVYGSCDSAQLEIFQAYRLAQLQAVAPALSIPSNGAFIDSCFVHETNVDYCSNQPVPNCIGWNTFNVTISNPNGPTMTLNMDQTMVSWYKNTLSNWDTIVEERQKLMDTVIDPAIAAGNDVNEAVLEHYRNTAGYDLTKNNNIPISRISGTSVQVVDPVEFPNNPTCPFPTPTATPAARY